jgi:hypothetical protein
MLAMVFSIIPRKDGNGWGLSKVHELIHIPPFIKYRGAPYNWNTEINESNHTDMAKRPAATAQKRKEEIYLPQVGQRIDDMNMIDYVRRNANIPSLNPIAPLRNYSQSWYQTAEHSGPTQKTPAWVLDAQGKFTFYHAGAEYLPNAVRVFVREMIQESKNSVDPIIEICGYTEGSVQGIPFRADFLYQKDKAWFDWCRCIYTDEDDTVRVGLAKMIAFLNVTPDGNKADESWDSTILVHWCDGRNQSDFSLDTLLQTSWRLLYKPDPKTSSTATRPYFATLAYESIDSQTFVVEETPGIHESEPPLSRVIEIAPRSEWSSIFINEDWNVWIRNLYKKQNVKENQKRFIGYNGRQYTILNGRLYMSHNYQCATRAQYTSPEFQHRTTAKTQADDNSSVNSPQRKKHCG